MEVPFNLPLHEPRTGLPLSMNMVQRVGKIDHIVKWHDAVCSLERKSTSRSIAPDSDYWDRISARHSQISMYALAFRDMAAVRPVLSVTAPCGNRGRSTPNVFGNTLYDRMAQAYDRSPLMLTQKETARNSSITGTVLRARPFQTDLDQHAASKGRIPHITVNGVKAQDRDPGKKGFALKETVEHVSGPGCSKTSMRRPEKFYYARREISPIGR